MGKVATIARRTFVIGTATVAGGFVLGWVAYKWPLPNPLEDSLDEDDVTLNPYLKIDSNGITIITPRAEVGQGAYSVQAALVAEELDVAWGEFRIDPGPPSKAYYNAAAFAGLLPVAAIDDGALAGRLRGLLRAYVKTRGLQITGGSSTVPDGFDKLRRAGATARAMLLEAAAQRLRVDVATLRTERAAVIAPDGTRLPYTELAADAARLTAPRDVALKDPRQWTLLGKPMQRLDIVDKSTGRARFGIDVRLEGMRYATVRCNPRRGRGVRVIDDSVAQRTRGVSAIVPVTDGVGVLADNTWRAFEAARRLELEFPGADNALGSEALAAHLEASFADNRRDSRLLDIGDVETALEANDLRVEAEYRLPFLAHAPLEPMNATVWLRDGRLDIWTGTQIPRFVVKFAADIAGIDESQVTLHAQMSGGSFGRRLDDDFVRQAVELAVAQPGRPIKMTWTREEDFTHDFPRPMAIGRGRGAVRDGTVHALSLDIASFAADSSQAQRLNEILAGPDLSLVAGAWDQPWAIPHYRVTGYRAPEVLPVSSWRSVGASINGFLHESFFDELCAAAGADPLAERLRLCTHEPTRRVLETIGELSNWRQPLGAGRGRGLALTISFGVPCAEVVEVTDTPQGLRIDRVFVVAEVGRVLDPVNFENQVQGGVIWGLGHAMHAELTYENGVAQQTNFTAFDGMRLKQVPEIIVRGLENGAQVRGIGEPPVPPAAPALANAIFAATGQRIRELPLRKQVQFA